MSGKVTVPDDAFLLLGEQLVRLDPQVQPNLGSGVYFKTWTGTVNGVPPTGGGGGGGALTLVIRDSFESQVDPWSPGARSGIWAGFVSNVVTRNVSLDRVSRPIHVYQTNGGHSYVLLPITRFLPENRA